MPSNKLDSGGLVAELHLAVSAKDMLTVNVDILDGLVNGARGTVEDVIKIDNEVGLVLVKFDHPRVGVAYRRQYLHPLLGMRQYSTLARAKLLR